MKSLIKVGFYVFILVMPVFAQIEMSNEQNSWENNPKYFEELLNFSSGQKGKTRVDIFIQLPYKNVQFIKKDNVFVSHYTMTLSVFNEDKDKLISEKTWNSKIEVNKFEETVSKKNYVLNLRSFYLTPGEYVLRTSVNDEESNQDMAHEEKFKVREISNNFGISDIMLLNKSQQEGEKHKISPNVSLNVANVENGLPIFYELYSIKARKITLVYNLRTKKESSVFADTTSRNIDSGKTQVFYTLKDSSFSFGLYTLSINALDTTGEEIASVSKSFFSRWIGMPVTLTDIDKAAKEMTYIASPSDIAKIRKAKTSKEKLKIFKEVWKKFDPTPGTKKNEVFDEYYRRVEYANAHFTRYYPGWRTDMGMVFILLGPPNTVDRHPFDINSKPYQVWTYYNLNQSFVFVDDTGFGDYRLVTPLTGDLYKFRR